MKQGIIKTIAFLLCLSLLTGCTVAGVDITKPTQGAPDETKNWPEGLLMTVNGQESDYREALLYLLAAKEEAELLYGEGVWQQVLDENGTTYGELRKQQVLDEYIDLKIVVSHASEYNLTIDEDENNDIAQYVAEFTANVGKDKLLAYNLSSEIIKKTYYNNMLATKVFEAITLSVDTNVSDSEARQSTYQYIFKSKFKSDENGEKLALSEEELESLRSKMKSIYETGKTKSNFLSYAQLNTEAASAQMTVGAGDLPDSISQLVLSLADNEFSPVLETDEGFYIFKCIAAFDEDATMAKKEAILSERQQAEFDSTFAGWKESAVIVINNSKWESINP